MNFFKTILILSFSTTLFAQKVNITSISMSAENLKKEIHFTGNAKVTQGKSWIHGDEIIVYFDDDNNTKKYAAIGNVTFEFKREKSLYKGSSDNITYYPIQAKYILTGHAVVDDLINKRHVNGDEITLDTVTGDANVKGSKNKPVKFIFNMKEKK